jgi:hypothetical protein
MRGACKSTTSARLVFRELENAKLMSSLSANVTRIDEESATHLGSEVEVACGITRWYYAGGTARACETAPVEKTKLAQQIYPNFFAKPNVVQTIHFNYEPKLNTIVCYQGTIDSATEAIKRDIRFQPEPGQEMIVSATRLQSAQDDSQSEYTRLLPFGVGLPILKVAYRKPEGPRNSNRWYEFKACSSADIAAAKDSGQSGGLVSQILHINANPENSFPAREKAIR